MSQKCLRAVISICYHASHYCDQSYQWSFLQPNSLCCMIKPWKTVDLWISGLGDLLWFPDIVTVNVVIKWPPPRPLPATIWCNLCSLLVGESDRLDTYLLTSVMSWLKVKVTGLVYWIQWTLPTDLCNKHSFLHSPLCKRPTGLDVVFLLFLFKIVLNVTYCIKKKENS